MAKKQKTIVDVLNDPETRQRILDEVKADLRDEEGSLLDSMPSYKPVDSLRNGRGQNA